MFCTECGRLAPWAPTPSWTGWARPGLSYTEHHPWVASHSLWSRKSGSATVPPGPVTTLSSATWPANQEFLPAPPLRAAGRRSLPPCLLPHCGARSSVGAGGGVGGAAGLSIWGFWPVCQLQPPLWRPVLLPFTGCFLAVGFVTCKVTSQSVSRKVQMCVPMHVCMCVYVHMCVHSVFAHSRPASLFQSRLSG